MPAELADPTRQRLDHRRGGRPGRREIEANAPNALLVHAPQLGVRNRIGDDYDAARFGSKGRQGRKHDPVLNAIRRGLHDDMPCDAEAALQAAVIGNRRIARKRDAAAIGREAEMISVVMAVAGFGGRHELGAFDTARPFDLRARRGFGDSRRRGCGCHLQRGAAIELHLSDANIRSGWFGPRHDRSALSPQSAGSLLSGSHSEEEPPWRTYPASSPTPAASRAASFRCKAAARRSQPTWRGRTNPATIPASSSSRK